MLARVANNLFWMGRYIERSEHIARYLSVNYFSSLDAPNEVSQSREFVLRSMLFVADEEELKEKKEFNESDILFDIGLNSEKSYSILSAIKNVQQNANGARDLISTELYESINTFNNSCFDFSIHHSRYSSQVLNMFLNLYGIFLLVLILLVQG